MTRPYLAQSFAILILLCAAWFTPVAAQNADDVFEQSRAALKKIVTAYPGLRDALGEHDLSGAEIHLINNPIQSLIIVDAGERGRGVILVAKPRDTQSRIPAGLYSFDFRTDDKMSVTRDGVSVVLKPIPPEVEPPATFFNVEDLCGGWPERGGQGLNFCEAFVACALYDLFC